MEPGKRGRGIVKPRIPAPQPMEFKRAELIRIVVAHLRETPHHAIASTIEQQSGVTAISELFANATAAIESRNWSLAFTQMLRLEFLSSQARSDAIKLIAEQWVADLALSQEHKQAVETIRSDVFPWVPDIAIQLTWTIFEPSSPKSSQEILSRLAELCSPGMFVDPGRLEKLLKFAKEGEKLSLGPHLFTGANATIEYLVLHCLKTLGFEDLATEYREAVKIAPENEFSELLAALGDQSWDLALSLMDDSLFDNPRHRRAAQRLVLKYALVNTSPVVAVKLARKHIPNDHKFVGSLLMDHTTPLDKSTFETSLGKHLKGSAIPSATMIEALCSLAISYQAQLDPYWCVPNITGISLINNLKSKNSMLPTTQTQELCHDGEVWDIAFSPNGKYLATATRSGSIYVWRTLESGLVQHSRYRDPGVSIQSICWSPDSTHVLAGCADGHSRLVNIDTMTEHSKFSQSNAKFGNISAVCWSPDGNSLYTGSYEGKLLRWTFERDGGTSQYTVVKDGLRILSLCITSLPGMTVLVALSVQLRDVGQSYHILDIFDTETHELIKECQIDASLSSLTVSGNVYAANVVPEGIWVWTWTLDTDSQDFDSMEKLTLSGDPIRDGTFIKGPEQEELRVNCSFGGVFDKYLVTGSEDYSVRIYNYVTKELVGLLTGHTDVVNTVKWSPTETMIASASDDRYVCIWRASS